MSSPPIMQSAFQHLIWCKLLTLSGSVYKGRNFSREHRPSSPNIFLWIEIQTGTNIYGMVCFFTIYELSDNNDNNVFTMYLRYMLPFWIGIVFFTAIIIKIIIIVKLRLFCPFFVSNSQ